MSAKYAYPMDEEKQPLPALTPPEFHKLAGAIAVSTPLLQPYSRLDLSAIFKLLPDGDKLWKTLEHSMKALKLKRCKNGKCESTKQEFTATNIDTLQNPYRDLDMYCVNCYATIGWLQTVAHQVISDDCRRVYSDYIMFGGKKSATVAQKRVVGDFAAAVGAAADADAGNRKRYPVALLTDLEMKFANNYMIKE